MRCGSMMGGGQRRRGRGSRSSGLNLNSSKAKEGRRRLSGFSGGLPDSSDRNLILDPDEGGGGGVAGRCTTRLFRTHASQAAGPKEDNVTSPARSSLFLIIRSVSKRVSADDSSGHNEKRMEG